jgi:hypothetical protein
LIKEKINELETLKNVMMNNERIREELENSLDVNISQKNKLQSMLMKVQSSKRRDLLELQVKIC